MTYTEQETVNREQAKASFRSPFPAPRSLNNTQ
jgi:hypothetical protein